MDNYATHQLVLLEVLKRTSKPVLELGAGDYSTPQVHTHESKVLTIDDSQKWIDKYSGLKSRNHVFSCFNSKELQKFYENDKEQWGLVFVDNSTWEFRLWAINRYKDTADYMIIHDTNYSASENIFGKVINGKRSFNEHFKHWIEFLPENYTKDSPATLLASNKFMLKDIVIQGMIPIFKS
jgi:hypothetical protein